MARTICAKPCLESGNLKIPLPLPGLSGYVEGAADISLTANCDGCQASMRLLVQIQPFLLSLVVPLCIFQCIWALFGCVRKVAGPSTISIPGVGSLGTAIKPFLDKDKSTPSVPDLSKIEGIAEALPFINLTKEVLFHNDDPNDPALAQRFEQVVEKCTCLFEWLDIFKWLCMTKGIILLIISVLNCISSLLQHALTVTLQIAGLAGSGNMAVQKTAVCLENILAIQLSNLAGRLEVFSILLTLTASVLEVICDLGFVPTALANQIRAAATTLKSLANGGSGGANESLQSLMAALKNQAGVGQALSILNILRCNLEKLYCTLDMMTSTVCAMPYTPKDPCADNMASATYCFDKYKV